MCMTFTRCALVLGWVACSAPSSPAHYCQLSALTPQERAHLGELSTTLASAVNARHELDDGYSFELGNVTVIGEWLDDVHRCCPTLDVALVAAPRGPFVLHITGIDAKPFIRGEFARLFGTT
jgi:hypothetical protein